MAHFMDVELYGSTVEDFARRWRNSTAERKEQIISNALDPGADPGHVRRTASLSFGLLIRRLIPAELQKVVNSLRMDRGFMH